MNSNSSSTSSNKAKLQSLKTEVASSLNVNLKQGYNGDITAREAGSIGGEMVKRMIAYAESNMGGNMMKEPVPFKNIHICKPPFGAACSNMLPNVLHRIYWALSLRLSRGRKHDKNPCCTRIFTHLADAHRNFPCYF